MGCLNVCRTGEHRKHFGRKNISEVLEQVDRVSPAQYTSVYHTCVGQRRPLVR